MRDRLVALLKDSKVYGNRFGDQYSDETIADIADQLLDNGVIVPPCKVGDTVYVIFSQFKNEILECRVDEFSIQKGEMSVIVDVHYTRFVAKRHASFPFSWFGRFAFLTRDGAESALRELSERRNTCD